MRSEEKRVSLKTFFLEQMVCLPLHCTVGEAYKKYYCLPLEKDSDNTTASLCFLLYDLSALNPFMVILDLTLTVLI